MAQCLDDVVANAAYVWNDRISANPNPVIETTAEMLGKMTIDVLADIRFS